MIIYYLIVLMSLLLGFMIGRGYKFGTLIERLYNDVMTLNTYIRISENENEEYGLTEPERETLNKIYIILDRLRIYARTK